MYMQESRAEKQARELKSHERHVQQNALLIARERSDRRVEYLTQKRINDEIHNQQKLEQQLIEKQRQENLRQEQCEREQKVAIELNRIKNEQLREVKLREQIKENDVDIRNLQSQLRAAYAQKQRAVQIAEKEARRIDELKEEATLHEILLEQNQKQNEDRLRDEALAVVEKQKYGNELKEQLEEKHEKARLAHEEFLREKKIIDDIVCKIQMEDAKNELDRLEKVKMVQKDREEFYEAKRQWKEREKEIIKMEQERIEKFRNIIELRRLQQKAHSDVLANAKEKAHQKLSQIIEKDQQKKEELEAIRQELYAEEQAQAADIQDEEALEKKLRRRIELQMENAKMLKYREQQRDKQKEQDAQIRRELLAKFAEDDRLEQMNQQKARMRREEHKRAAEQILIDRREERLRMKNEKEAELAEKKRLDELRKQIVDEERLKLLKEHAMDLVGYLPKCIFQDEKEMRAMGPEFVKKFDQLKTKYPDINDY